MTVNSNNVSAVSISILALFFFGNPAWADRLEAEPVIAVDPLISIDDNLQALYGEPVQHLITRVRIDGSINPFEDKNKPYESRQAFFDLEKEVNTVLFGEVMALVPKDVGVDIRKNISASEFKNKSAVYVVGFQIFFKKMEEPSKSYIAMIDPVMGRFLPRIGYPYHRYVKPEAFIFSPGTDDFSAAFQQAIKPMILAEMQRLLCEGAVNHSTPLSLCID